MEVIQLDYSSKEHINLYPIGDLHLGDNNCNVDEIKKVIEAVKEDENALIIGMGDWLNVATKQSVGKAVFDQCMDTTAQIKFAVELFSPVKDKIIGLLEGNHEFRASKEGINVTELLALNLGTRFLGYSAAININVDGSETIIFATHGHGGGASKSGVVNKVAKLSDILVADIYLRGHSHQLISFKEPIRMVEGSRIVERIRWYVDTGAFLNYDNGYAEMGNFKPGNIGCPLIKISKSIDIKV